MPHSTERPLRVLLLMSGSIAAFKVVQLVSRLVQAPVSAEVEVVMTPAARAFIGEASLEGLTGRRVRSETFGAGDHMEHIRLVRWADVVLAAPCTANTVNKLARGIGDDLVGTLFLAHDFAKPWLIAPAMNTRMYEHPATRESLALLRAMGCTLVEGASGALACGETGSGRLAEPEVLLEAVLRASRRSPEMGPAGVATAAAGTVPATQGPASARPRGTLKVLVTAGGTRMPLDAVRSIVNGSTGRTGAAIAEDLAALGHEVTLLTAADAPAADGVAHLRRYDDFDSFAEGLRSLLSAQRFDLLVQAAAVSDWRPVLPAGAAGAGKLDADADTLTLRFERTPKLVGLARGWSRDPQLRIVAFKLTARATPAERRAKVAAVLAHEGVVAVIANDLADWPRWEFWTDASREPETYGDRGDMGARLAALLDAARAAEGRT